MKIWKNWIDLKIVPIPQALQYLKKKKSKW